jgi:hypothetical protein
MSDFRPVKEVWGAHSAAFIEPSDLITVLREIAEEKGLTCTDDHAYGNAVFWVEDGKAFLEAVKQLNDTDFEGYGFAAAEDSGSNPAAALIQNMKALADQWLGESLNEDGSLRFYVDD